MKKLFCMFLVLLLALPAEAAIPAGAIWQLNASATALNVNGGFFNPANAAFITDYTATSATGNSPVISSATYNFVAGDVGAWLYISAGTNWVSGRYCQIASVASNQATLTATAGTCVDVANRVYTVSATAGVATVASPTGGTIGVDYSKGTASITTATDLASVDASVNPCAITSVAAPMTLSMAGNGIRINTAGVNFTTGWYEVVSVSVVTATLDRACGSAAATGGTFHVGGAMSMASTLDDDLFEVVVVGNDIFAKNGTYSFGETISTSGSGGASSPIALRGYNSILSDVPTGATRPTFASSSNAWTAGAANWDLYNLIVTGTAASVLNQSVSGKFVFVKVTNTSPTANRDAFRMGTNGLCIFCEGISYRGRAISTVAVNSSIKYGYFHDSDVGIISTGTTAPVVVIGNIVTSIVTAGIQTSSTQTGLMSIASNTIYGTSAKRGTCIAFATGTTNVRVENNIITGCATGVSHADTQSVGLDLYNDYFNNTSDVSAAGQWQKGLGATAVDPSFTSMSEVTGATATTTAGNHLVQAGATFVTSGVTAGRDFVYLSGTGVTTGIYGILTVDSETQITTDITLTADATADKVFSISIGHNVAVGSALSGLGAPGVFPGALTTGYKEQGATSRQGTSVTGGGIIGQ